MAARSRDRVASGPEPVGAMLTRLRLARGFSQLRLAERLCVAAGVPTVSRHEISRWERAERVPGGFWLGWLAVVLDAPLAELESAAAAAGRRAAGDDHRVPDHRLLWRPPTADELLAALESAGGAGDADLRELALAWLAGPAVPAPGGVVPAPEPVGGGDDDDEPLDLPLDRVERRLADLRRADDLLGGVDLARHVDRELHAAVRLLRTVDPRRRRRLFRLVAELAQLAGWVHADAGSPGAARRAYRVALRAAAAGVDRSLAAHVLGCLSQLSLAAGDPHEALLLAHTARSGAAAGGSALTQALLLHRIALAAARAGERRTAQAALVAAEQMADRSRPGQEPSWLYWLDQAELTAMTGRCLAALGRPLRAARRLATPRRGAGPRTAALYGACLARSYLELGEVELACRVAMRALRNTVRAGSVRAATGLRYLHPVLLQHREVPAVRTYERLTLAVSDCLPAPVQPSAGAARPFAGSGSGGVASGWTAAGGARRARPPPPDSVAG